jgi:hypothetical protein
MMLPISMVIDYHLSVLGEPGATMWPMKWCTIYKIKYKKIG